MYKWNKKIFDDYKPTIETFDLALNVTKQLGKISVRLRDVFIDFKRPSRLFAFIESKYSHKIEGIYTTLFDIVNTKSNDKPAEITNQLVSELFKSKEMISYNQLLKIADKVNININSSERFKKVFGVYEEKNNSKRKIYEPPKDKKLVKSLLKDLLNKMDNNQDNIINIIYNHILFEKIHPFVDGNGRIGRMLLQKQLNKIMNFSNVLPVSWTLSKYKMEYYKALDFNDVKGLDSGIKIILNLILKMCEVIKRFTIKLKEWLIKSKEIVLNISNKVTDQIAEDILLNLQTKRSYFERKYKWNIRTIDKLFENINKDIPFNIKNVNRYKLYWNIELEEIVDKYFGQ